MLFFKENIYLPGSEDIDRENPEPLFDPYSFIMQALVADREIFHSLKQIDSNETLERLATLFPHASRFGGVDILNSISKRLLEAIVQPQVWYKMNAYHYCFLYDNLASVVEEYSYSDIEQRVQSYPEMMGTDINFNEFLNKYFFNTAFLINLERFNEMTAQEKLKLGLDDNCLFGVINRLTPTDEEITLTVLEKDPY
ncbi:uncharacterized protein METZ01_LOCUS339874 [marine metagenome]|uniref:Uncharacterized protein n=1 Tax=marine metagenome TaxID=408172 RepID=A0A382QQ68_9ZZZZ